MKTKITNFVVCFSFLCSLNISFLIAQQGALVPTDNSQKQLIQAYKLVLEASSNDFRSTGTSLDTDLFPEYSEYSVYWSFENATKGDFVYPDMIPDNYQFVTTETYLNYQWHNDLHYSLQFKKHPERIGIFKSKYQAGDNPVSWQSIYFERLNDEFLLDDTDYIVNEDTLDNETISKHTQLLIIPAFTVKEQDYTFYIDSIFNLHPDMGQSLMKYVQNGGYIYAEGNAGYFLEKIGLLETGTMNYSPSLDTGEGIITIQQNMDNIPVSLSGKATGNKLYAAKLPKVNASGVTNVFSIGSDPVVFFKNLGNGTVLCNTGLPTAHGLNNLEQGSQISWTLNAIMSAFAVKIDVNRRVLNDLKGFVAAGPNAISYDRVDTFEVELTIRNLTNQIASNIKIHETITPYFNFLDVISGDAHSISEKNLVFDEITLNAHSEKRITYRLITPNPESFIHEDVDKYLSEDTNIPVSKLDVTFRDGNQQSAFKKTGNYANLLFSARIFADTDVNWKNFLGLKYQPFKVFMIMENKSRTPAEEVVYTQYIPKDVPFYWSDQSLNIPILKTPGGEFVDVLKGSNDENNPDYDMDSDGHPDVWLDTTTIFPKGYTIEEEEVYWANPWNHLRTGDDAFVFEDIDHDGNVALDNDGDGVVDVEEPGDKIRVWKVTWNAGSMKGYEYYDPYCSYEIWVDPPDLVPLSAGVGFAHDSVNEPYPDMFYPYTEDIETADVNNDGWKNWMEKDENDNIIWKQLVHQKINNYEGFTFIDTASSNYKPLPTDSVIGTVPQPHREFIAVLSLGGEEIDMRNPTPTQSLYSKVNYKTIFDEERMTPIRTTYTYYAPLPNPLQFEYLSNNFEIFDTTGSPLEELPEWGKAKLVFDMDASTEYTYYWIRNVGYDVDYNDPSEAMDGIEPLGDGVFGYFIYSIPKGMGGYRISLPVNEDGSYAVDSIVQIDGKPFGKWIDNPNTWNEVEIWETPFQYDIYIPQLLIPPALDDNNFDGIDDWIDDRGDRFSSKTGFLHDAFMPGNGEDWTDYPDNPFRDDIYGWVDSGWYAGADNTYGDDFFENLGKTHIQIHANYEGKGREGLVEISKGGVLVVEEIFGGSPWVIFSHVLSGSAKGVDISLTSSITPEVVYYGIDTVYVNHTIQDVNEPHDFDVKFDPYHLSYGYGESTITTFVGAKDPCSLLDPVIDMPAIIDPAYDTATITLVPNADPGNPDLTEFPKSVHGTFVEVRVEVTNGTNNNWINTTIAPQIPESMGASTVEMSYVAYPRPLVPSHADGSGNIIPGDQPGTFTTGWRFNQPEGEVLIKMGNALNLMQPTRRAYFVFLLNIDPELADGIYEIPFTIDGSQVFYTGEQYGTINYLVPSAKICITEKNKEGKVKNYQKLILDEVSLRDLNVNYTSNFKSLGNVKWSISQNEYNLMENEMEGSNGKNIDLSVFQSFPTTDTTEIYLSQMGVVDSYNTSADQLKITNGQQLAFEHPSEGTMMVSSNRLLVTPVGPRVKITNNVYTINGILVSDTVRYNSDEEIFVWTTLEILNTGSDISSNTEITIYPGDYYIAAEDSLPAGVTIDNQWLIVNAGEIIPGEKKEIMLPFRLGEDIPKGMDIRTLIQQSNIEYEGTLIDASFSFMDPEPLLLGLYDFEVLDIYFVDNRDGTVQVSATAGNRGVMAHDIWFRIYPVIGEGIAEFPLAEIKIDTLKPGETVFLSSTYTLPNVDRSVEFIAVIDDNRLFTEATEMNNSLKIPFSTTDSNNELLQNQNAINIYPLPFNDVVTFEYNLEKNFNTVTICIYNIRGKCVARLSREASVKGHHMLKWRNTEVPTGVYFYRITGQSQEGYTVPLYNGKLVKSN